MTWLSWQESESPYGVLADHLGVMEGMVLDPMVRTYIGTGLAGAARSSANEAQGQAGENLSSFGAVSDAVALIRERKDEREVGLLRCANQVGLQFWLYLRLTRHGQMTLYAIRKTRSRMHIGITEFVTHAILKEEMAAIGLVGGDGLVLFGGQSSRKYPDQADDCSP